MEPEATVTRERATPQRVEKRAFKAQIERQEVLSPELTTQSNAFALHTMALPFLPGLTPNEVGFLCEMEMVTVIPRQRLDALELLGVSIQTA